MSRRNLDDAAPRGTLRVEVLVMKALLGVLTISIAGTLGWLFWPRSNTEPRQAPPEARALAGPAVPVPPAAQSATVDVPAVRVPAGGPLVLSGFVLGFPRHPIPNATVSLLPMPATTEAGNEPLAKATTNEAGEYRLTLLDTWPRNVVLVASAPNHRSGTLPLQDPAKPLNFVLRQSITLFGRVCEEGSGQPLADVAVASGADTVRTGANGDYRLETDGMGGQASVTATLPGFSSQQHSVLARGVTEPVQVDFAMRRTMEVMVQVVDAATRAPIVDVRTCSSPTGRDRVLHPSGSFPVIVAIGDYFSTEVAADGYCAVEWTWRVEALPEGELKLPLMGAATITGTVADRGGSPLARCRVEAQQSHEGNAGNPQFDPLRARFGLPGTMSAPRMGLQSRTDAQGRYRISAPPGDAPYTVSATCGGYASTTSAPRQLTTPGTVVCIDLVLMPATTLAGTARRNGEPWRGDVFWLRPDGSFGGRAATNEQGGYELKDVPPGAVEVALRAEGSSRLVQRARLTMTPGTANRHDFVWQETPHTIRGRATLESGEPVSGAQIQAQDARPQGGFRQARTLADGSYCVEVDAEGVYSVQVVYEEVRRERSGIGADTAAVDFVLPVLGRLRLRLVDAATQRPVADDDSGTSSLGWREPAESEFHTARRGPDSVGGVELRLPLGRVDVALHLQHMGYAPRIATGLLVTREADPAPIPIELTRGVSASLTVTGPAGFADARANHLLFLLERSQLGMLRGPFPSPGGPSNARINGIHVWLEQHGLMQQMPRFDANGKAHVTGLMPGHYRLVALPEDLVFTPVDVEITADGANVALEWRRH